MYLTFRKIYFGSFAPFDKTLAKDDETELSEDCDTLETDGGIIRRVLKRDRIPASAVSLYIDGYAYPGFNDSHMHLVGMGKKLSSADCTGCKSRKEIAERIRAFLKQNAPAGKVSVPSVSEENMHAGASERNTPERNASATKWLLGRGWNQDLFDDGRLPSRHDLDGAADDLAIVIHRVCGHIAVLNTKALRELGILNEDDTPNLPRIAALRAKGGEADIDPNGDVTGILRENALNEIPESFSEDELIRFVLKAQDYLLSLGITSVQTDDLYFTPNRRDMISIFEKLERDGRLKIKVYEQSQIPAERDLETFYRQDKSGESHKKFKTGPLKMLSDGSLGARTAYMRSPYADAPDTVGILTVPEARLKSMIETANRCNIDAAVHAIGDGAVEILLGLYASAPAREKQPRNTIVHCQIMDFEQIDRMAKLGIGAMVQPIFLEYDLTIVESRVGSKKAESSYAYRTMLDRGIKLAFGSDAPVEDPNPLAGMHFAVNREKEAVTLEEAVAAYTVAGAYYSYEEHRKGLLKPGYSADIAVFREEITAENLKHNQNIATFVNGELLYRFHQEHQ